jgi:hypothetical protein
MTPNESEDNPRIHPMFISAHAHQPAGSSPTGAPQVRAYGKALYDYNEDKITHNPNGA